MSRARWALALALVAGLGCGEKRSNRASCLRGLDLCVRELAARGCASASTVTPAATTPAIGAADAGVGPGMNEASCLRSHQTCRERLAACPAPTPAPR